MEISNINIDFEVIPTNNPKRLWITDCSDWSVAENKASIISITPPGSNTAINNTFVKHNLNVFHSVNLLLSCLAECKEQIYQDLPDGIYTIKLSSAFTNIDKTRYFLKTDLTQLRLDEVYIKAGLEYDKSSKSFREDLQDIEFLLRTASAHTRNSDVFKANRDFSLAQELLSKYISCKNCL